MKQYTPMQDVENAQKCQRLLDEMTESGLLTPAYVKAAKSLMYHVKKMANERLAEAMTKDKV